MISTITVSFCILIVGALAFQPLIQPSFGPSFKPTIYGESNLIPPAYAYSSQPPPTLVQHQQFERRIWENNRLPAVQSFQPSFPIVPPSPNPIPAPAPFPDPNTNKIWVPTHDSAWDHLAGTADSNKGVFVDKEKCQLGSDAKWRC
eukprot:12690_1